MNKKVEELSELELKALAFEHTLQLEHSQGAIVAIKNELLRRQQEITTPPDLPPVEAVTPKKK